MCVCVLKFVGCQDYHMYSGEREGLKKGGVEGGETCE